MALGTSSDSSTEIIVISLFTSISSNSDRIAKDDLSLLIASSFTDIEIIDTVSIIQKHVGEFGLHWIAHVIWLQFRSYRLLDSYSMVM